MRERMNAILEGACACLRAFACLRTFVHPLHCTCMPKRTRLLTHRSLDISQDRYLCACVCVSALKAR